MTGHQDNDRHSRRSNRVSLQTPGSFDDMQNPPKHGYQSVVCRHGPSQEAYNERNKSGRGRSVKVMDIHNEAEFTSSSDRSLSVVRKGAARSSSKHPTSRSAITQHTTVLSSRGRSLSTARSTARAPSNTRTVRRHENVETAESLGPSVTSRSRSKSKSRSQSRARSKSKRRMDQQDEDSLERNSGPNYVDHPNDYHEYGPGKDSESSKSSLEKSSSSIGQQGTRKFIVEIDGDSNNIIDVNEVLENDDLECDVKRSSVRRERDQPEPFERPIRSRSRSILRSHKSSITSQDRVTFALDFETTQDDGRTSGFIDENESTNRGARGRALQDRQSTRQTRSLSRQHCPQINEVNFNPKRNTATSGLKYKSNGSLVPFERPSRPYDQCPSPITNSNNTEETTYTIDEEDDDSFGCGYGRGSMKAVMVGYEMDEEEEDGTILSGGLPVMDNRYKQTTRNKVFPQDTSMRSSSSSFKNKLKPVTFNSSRKLNLKLQTSSSERSRSKHTENTSNLDFHKTPALFVERAADSLLFTQKKQHQEYQAQECRKTNDSEKPKSRLGRFLKR